MRQTRKKKIQNIGNIQLVTDHTVWMKWKRCYTLKCPYKQNKCVILTSHMSHYFFRSSLNCDLILKGICYIILKQDHHDLLWVNEPQEAVPVNDLLTQPSQICKFNLFFNWGRETYVLLTVQSDVSLFRQTRLQINNNLNFSSGINTAESRTSLPPCSSFTALSHPYPSLSAPAPAGWWRKAGRRWRSRRCPGRGGRWPPAAAGPSRSPGPPQTPARWFWSWTGRPRCSVSWGWVGSGSPSHWHRQREKLLKGSTDKIFTPPFASYRCKSSLISKRREHWIKLHLIKNTWTHSGALINYLY